METGDQGLVVGQGIGHKSLNVEGMLKSTYRILVLNSTAIVCAIVLILLTNSMPASRATAITHSLSHVLLVSHRSLRRLVLDRVRCAPATPVAIAFCSCHSVSASSPQFVDASLRNVIKKEQHTCKSPMSFKDAVIYQLSNR